MPSMAYLVVIDTVIILRFHYLLADHETYDCEYTG